MGSLDVQLIFPTNEFINLEKVFSLKQTNKKSWAEIYEKLWAQIVFEIYLLSSLLFNYRWVTDLLLSLRSVRYGFPLFGPCSQGTGKEGSYGVDGWGKKSTTPSLPDSRQDAGILTIAGVALHLRLLALTLSYTYLRDRCERVKAVLFPWRGDEERGLYILRKAWRIESRALPQANCQRNG